ncbi:MAG: hypothetical protein IT367_16785 [Candidatus Hydrogenedentes bacterium]|nr:hypothetical protein [Candidatus Hydrogenedentota bacterium]
MSSRGLWRACALATALFGVVGVSSRADDGPGTFAALRDDRAFQAVLQFAQTMMAHGRDSYGEKKSPLFVAQLNVETQRIPEGTDADPGLWRGHLEVAGYQAFCQNLLQDQGLLDVLRTLTTVTGDAKYDAALRDYLAYVLNDTRDPRSGYIPWGEHVGFDVVQDRVHVGEVKYWHEVKAYNIAWDQLWDVNPEATRHEIETAFYNHICDPETFAFNRHATMDGKPNSGTGVTSLLSSAGVYIDAWCWLYKKTGDAKFLEWAKKMNALAASRCEAETGLLATDDYTRPEEMVYSEAAAYAPYLFVAADILGDEGKVFREEAIAYLNAYEKYAYVAKREDTGGPGYCDALNIKTGKPIDKGGGRYLEAWTWKDNHEHVGVILSAYAIGYSFTGDERFRAMCDHAIEALEIQKTVAEKKYLLSCDLGGAIMSMVLIAKRSGDGRYLEQAKPLVEFALKNNFVDGCFTSGMENLNQYYCNRAGSGYLAAAVLNWALAAHGHMDMVSPVRDFQGGLRF